MPLLNTRVPRQELSEKRNVEGECPTAMVSTGMGVPSTPRHRKPCMHTRDEAAAGRQGAEERRLLHSPLSLGKTHWATLFKVLTPPATLQQ